MVMFKLQSTKQWLYSLNGPVNKIVSSRYPEWWYNNKFIIIIY